MDQTVFQILSGAVVPSIYAIIRMYSSISVLQANYKNMNAELQETKQHHNFELNQMTDKIEKRMDKLEELLQKLLTQGR